MPTPRNSDKALTIVCLVSVGLSILVRIPDLANTSYTWRPLATQLTTVWFEKEGIDLLQYQTPILGPPWQIPFEFPLFQALAAVLSLAGLHDTELASRLSALLCFYLSALFLYLLCAKVFAHKSTEIAVVGLFLWLPYNIYYSTEAYMDYLALGLTLGYLYFIILWLRMGNSPWYAIAAAVSGGLGMLVKPTTALVAAVPILALVLQDIVGRYRDRLRRPVDLRAVARESWRLRTYWLALGAMAAVPLVLGALWTRHADQIKEQSIYTRFLTSGELVPWNFGTAELRADPSTVMEIARMVQAYLAPHGLIFLVALGILVAVGVLKDQGTPSQVRLFIGAMAVGTALVPAVFLNLYFVHSYYYMALSASMAILAGYGLMVAWRLLRKIHPGLVYALALWGLVFALRSYGDYDSFRAAAAAEKTTMVESRAWASQVQAIIPQDRWIVVLEISWQPHAPYLLERKTLVVSNQNHRLPLCHVLEDDRFGYVILSRLKDTYRPENEERLVKVLGCFESYVEVMPDVYKVAHQRAQ